MFDLSAFTTAQIVVVACAVAYVAGVITSTKVLDLVKGVPSDVRSALTTAEADTLGKLQTATAAVKSDVLSALPGASAKKAALKPVTGASGASATAPAASAAAPAPVAPAATAAPAPAPTPAAQ